MLTPGQKLQNRYEIIAPLGAGGMGAVYRAKDLNMNRVVAVKEHLPDPNASPQTLAQARAQFQREAQILGALSHANLAHVYDFFSFGANEYIVMELIEGQSLEQIVQQYGAVNEGAVRAWALQVLDALNYVHAQNVIHRDIKPANIILKPDGKVVLVDFGLVKLIDPNNPYTMTALRGMGTAGYAPIEQYAVGVGHTDARSDIYSLGATLYRLLTAREPVEVHQRLLNPTALPTPRVVNSKISQQAEMVVLKAMEVYPQNRFQSAVEMRQALLASTAPAQQPPPSAIVPTVSVSRPQSQYPVIVGGDGKRMILVPAGEFEMGSNEEERERPVHKVYLDAFYIDETPVTNDEYKRFLDANPTHPAPPGWDQSRRTFPAGKENHPVVNVSWFDANDYASWAGKRLPTEAEWEKAASWDDQKKKKRIWPWGDTFNKNLLNSFEGGRGKTAPVDLFPTGASPYGVLDMAGNVWEWVADRYDPAYFWNSPARDPAGPSSGKSHVLRGGAWDFNQDFVRAAYRYFNTPDFRDNFVGFRCAQ
jgi:serine/threonine-protein kinase